MTTGTEEGSFKSNHVGQKRIWTKRKTLGVWDMKKIYPQSLNTQIIDGMLWSSLPRIKIFLSFIKNYPLLMSTSFGRT